MSEKITLTETQRKAAVDQATVSMALRSGAGCGKTFVLARRYAELLRGYRGDDSPVQHFVALTFTEKATLEMSQRVRKLLGELASDAAGDERKRLRRWIDELPEARISTIHGFCASLLRGHAIEARIDPSFEVCSDDLLADYMRTEACDEALLAAVEAGDSRTVQLLAHDSYTAITDLLATLVNRREVFDASDYVDAEQILARWEQLLRNERKAAWRRLENDTALAEKIRRIASVPCDDRGDKLLPVRDKLMSLAGQIIERPAQRTAESFQRVCGAKLGNVGSAKAWGGRDAPRELRNRIKDVQAGLDEYALYAEELNDADRRAADALAALVALAGEAQRRYADEKRKRGLLDFTDLLTTTDRMLAENNHVREHLARQIDQLLVDECQDTDAFQLSMLERLLPVGRPDGGQVFIVGDAKQSIYRFRGADVDQFEQVCKRMGEGRSEHLDLSFRAHEAGVAFVNHVFAPLMGEQYERIRAYRRTPPPHRSVDILLAGRDEGIDSAADAGAAQAQLTAQRIAEMLQGRQKLVRDEQEENWRAVQPGDIAILFSRMTNSLEYERELQRRDIPYYVVAGTGFFQQQEVFDVLNALRVVDNPLDDIAFMGMLRSSLIGLDDNALMHIVEVCGQGPYLQKLAEADLSDRLSPGQLDALSLARELPALLGRMKDAVGIDELIERLLDETAYEAVLGSQFQGRRMLGNVRQLVAMARTATAEGVALGDFIRQTGELVLRESRYEQAVVAGESDNVVRLMTVHKAKGLEFPVVIVPDLNAGRRGFVGSLLHRAGDWGWTLDLRRDDDADGGAPGPLSFCIASGAEDADLKAEDIRKLYVAITRHKDYLVLIGADRRTSNGRFAPRHSYLGTLDGVLGIAAAIDTGAEGIAYGDDRFEARVGRIVPVPAGVGRAAGAPGQEALRAAASGDALADAMLSAARNGDMPQMVGPLPVSTARALIAVTALSDFEHCPMLYRWRYELRVPTGLLEAGGGQTARRSPTASLDPATSGTLFHRCMELLDFAAPQPPAALVQQVVCEMGLEDIADAVALTDELDGMIRQFRQHALWKELAAAKQTFRELDFALDLEHASLRGQIDMLYQDPAGPWHIVDYKSDDLDTDRIPARAEGYELQMLTYALAAGKHLDTSIADAMLYFLRPGAKHCFEVTPRALDRIEERIQRLATELIVSRRAGDFARHQSSFCDICPYREVCRRCDA